MKTSLTWLPLEVGLSVKNMFCDLSTFCLHMTFVFVENCRISGGERVEP